LSLHSHKKLLLFLFTKVWIS